VSSLSSGSIIVLECHPLDISVMVSPQHISEGKP
jgi:hypothetical protein